MNLLKNTKRIHMIGIIGTGMSALAVNFKHMGFSVSGSDFDEKFFTDTLLKKQGLKVKTPFSPQNIPTDTQLVIVSTAYNNKNHEIQEAKRRGLLILNYPQALGLLIKELPSVAVCGSHGKTTTSGALGYILSKTDYRPIVNVGSIVPQLLSYRAHNPKLFVFEADEYQNKFKYFNPKYVILTNVDYDHPDFFKNPKQYKSVFLDFIKRIPRSGLLIYCADDKNCRDVAKYAKCKKIGYGFSVHSSYRVQNVKIEVKTMKFKIVGRLLHTTDYALRTNLLGNHNALTLTAAALCAAALNVPAKQIQKAVSSFRGTKRRLEIVKNIKINGRKCIIIDDYGHHPTEIKATIETLKATHPDKTLWTVFQPHTFSRTEALFNDFSKCFAQSDKTIILDIYASKREAFGKTHSRDLVRAINNKNVVYKSGITQAANFLKKQIKTDSVVLTIGASNVWELAKF